MPAAFTWTGAVSAAATNPVNWTVDGSPGLPEDEGGVLPGEGDDVYFGAVTGGSPDCVALYSSGTFNSVTLAADYNGTVSVAQDNAFDTNLFTLAGGAIAQPSPYATPIDIRGVFTWTGGILNSALTGGTVRINGGGTITAPESTALNTGSDLIFGSSDGNVKTTTVDATVYLNGPNEYALVGQQNAKVVNVVRPRQVGTVGNWQCVDPVKKVLTLDAGHQWGYAGTGTTQDDLRVVNNGGIFYLAGQVTLKLAGGNAITPAYTQSGGSLLFTPKLQIMSGSALDVSASKGALVNGGFVHVVPNSDLGLGGQIGTLKGNYEMAGGSIGFPNALKIGEQFAWFKFKVDGAATWSGGDFATGVEGAVNGGEAHRWEITGKLTVDTSKAVKPRIYLAAGGTINFTWDVILCDTTADASLPTGGANYAVEGIMNKKGFRVKWTG